MKRTRKFDPPTIVDESLLVKIFPVVESSADFQKRENEIHQIIIRMIFLGQKRGRPVLKEDCNEEAA